jgi:DNA-binding transcriptional MocR family regulator
MYLQIADFIMEKVQDHTLPEGAKLPPERELAAIFHVSRTTAINAYRHLEQQGVVETKIGSGTYIAKRLSLPGMPWSQLFIPRISPPVSSMLKELAAMPVSDDAISFAAGMPDPNLYPVDSFSTLFSNHIGELKNIDLGHIPTEGYPPLRHSIAAMMKQKNIPAVPENTLIVSGSQQGLYLLTKVFISPGDYVIVQSPTYRGAIQAFQSAGARLLTFPATEPLPLTLLEDYLIRYRPKMLYILPTYQNPTGRALSLDERVKLLQLASEHRLIVIEDDPYGELYYKDRPPASLLSLDHYGGVIYLGTFSKILFPGLRTSWLIAPEAVISRIVLEKQYVDLHSCNFSQWLLYLYLQQGLLEQHLAFIRSEYKNRRDAAVSALRRYFGGALSFKVPEGGFYLWCRLEETVTGYSLLHEAIKSGVSFTPGEAFYADAAGERELRICFTTHNEEVITEGIKRLSKCLNTLLKEHSLPAAGHTLRGPFV